MLGATRSRLPALSDPLAAQLEGAADSLVTKRPKVACATMSLFIVGVKLVPSRHLTSADRADLIGDATRIRAVIGC